MKSAAPQSLVRQQGFTLIEMIGVLAIMAILAAVITPNALRTLDRAAVRAEAETLHNLGEQAKLFLKAKGWAPGLNPIAANRLSWDQDLATFADISPAEILTNKRQMARSYIYEPTASPRRVLIISSMRTGLALPLAANINAVPLFDNIWDTADGAVPPAGTSWAGWTAWRNTLNGTAGDYLVIERVNLAPTSNADLQTEINTVQKLGEQVKLFLQAKGWAPGLNPVVANRLSWDKDLGAFADISSADILINKRQNTRSFIYEPTASPKRVLILSSMSTVTGLTLPLAANLNTLALFNNVWDTADSTVPPTGTSWTGWAAWRATFNNGAAGDYPVIERVNLAPTSNNDLQTEINTVHKLGEQVKLFLQTKGWAPGLNPVVASRLSWNQDLGTFADISPVDILTNKRQNTRSYIYEPTALPKRVLVISSMSTATGLTLPLTANLNTLALFDNVWNTADGAVPPTGTSWTGWAAWRATFNNGAVGDYPVIERVNLVPLYLTVVLNNRSATTVSYNIVGQVPVNILAPVPPATNTSVTIPCFPGYQINLYRAAGGATFDYSYVVTTTSSGRTFDFNTGTNWVPQP